MPAIVAALILAGWDDGTFNGGQVAQPGGADLGIEVTAGGSTPGGWNDSHASGEYRADTVRNADVWYKSFDV
jgi:hypothetical protein